MRDEEFNEWFLSAGNAEKIEKVKKFLDFMLFNREKLEDAARQIVGIQVRLNEFEKLLESANEAERRAKVARLRFIQSANALEESILIEMKTESLRDVWGNILREFRLLRDLQTKE